MNVEQHNNIMKTLEVCDIENDIQDNRFEAEEDYVYVTFNEITDMIFDGLSALHLKYDIKIFPNNENELQVNFREKTNAN